MSAPIQPAERNVLIGSLLMIMSVACFSVLDATMKHLVQTTNPFFLSWARMFVQVVLLLALAPLLGGRAMFVSARPLLLLARGATLACVTVLVILSVSRLPLTQVYVIGFATPFIATMLAAAALAERASKAQWLLITAGFAGVLIALQPGAPDAGWHLAYPLGFAFFNAVYFVLTRAGGRSGGALAQLFYVGLFACLFLAVLLPWSWSDLPATGWLKLVGTGVLGTLGHLMLIQAFQRGPTAVVAPMVYFGIIWTGFIDYFAFAQLPPATTWAGAAVIVASGVALMRSRA